jgi:hypothetical protein
MMITLPSSDGPRRLWLMSPKTLQAMSSSYKVSGAGSSSYEDRSTTGNPSEGSLCSYIRNDSPWDEPSIEEAGGGEDGVGEEGGADASLEEDEDALA